MSASHDGSAGAQGRVLPEIYPVVTRTADDAPAMYHDDPSYTDTYAKLYDWTWTVPISAPARALYCYILHRIGANKDGKAWPRRKTVAEALKISERSLHSYLHELEHHGLIRIHNFDARDGRPSEYYAQTRKAVSARQILLQNLQEPPPLAKSARPRRKICKTPMQILQGNKGDVDTEKQIQETDTEDCADKPRRARKTVCRSPEEEDDREAFLKVFNDTIRPIDHFEQPRCRKEALDGLREHGLDDMMGCVRAMGTSKEFVGRTWATPVAVVRNVLLWQDAGRPRRWQRVDEFKREKVRRQGGA